MARKCRHCRVEIPPKTKSDRWQSVGFCNLDHMSEHGLEKARKRRKRESDERHRTLKRKVKLENISHQKQLTQDVFNRMRVLEELEWFRSRGIEPYCISCQNPLGNDVWSCGHFVTVGSNSRLRYDRNNTFLQHNTRCNMHRSGDIEGYKKGLSLRFGESEAARIIDYCETRNSPRSYTGIELKEMRTEFYRVVKKLRQA